MSHSLLARFAENMYWFARYVERSENLARIIDVNETFARDSQGAQDWLPIIRLHDDEKRFREAYRTPDAASVIRFYILDKENTNSIISSLRAARDNARGLRHLISLEVWFQINVLCNWALSLGRRDVHINRLSALCARIKEGCQLVGGIAESTLYRDQVWLFYRLGRAVERCDQITRLVDIKYHTLLPAVDTVGKAADIGQWNALLRSAAAYHGYRRVYHREMSPTTVSGFMLLDARFPRSVTSGVAELRAVIEELRGEQGLDGADALAALARLESLCRLTPEQLIDYGLHEFSDRVQRELIAFSKVLEATFFKHQV